jgi:hypothetical protein
VLPAALAIALIVAPAAAAGVGPAKQGQVRAKASGSDGPPPVLPSLVRTRIARGEKAIDRAADYVDRDMPDKAVASLRNVRRNMYAAWRGATDVVENAPPPAPPAGDGRPMTMARASATYVGPEETAVAVLNLQHDVAAGSFGLLDGAKGVLRDAVSRTIFAALNRRDQAIVYIHNRPVPPPVAEAGRLHSRARGGAHARAADEDAPPSFASLMPGIVPDLEDELGQTKGLLRGGALTPGEKRIIGQARAQVLETKDQVNTWWPALPVGD